MITTFKVDVIGELSEEEEVGLVCEIFELSEKHIIITREKETPLSEEVLLNIGFEKSGNMFSYYTGRDHLDFFILYSDEKGFHLDYPEDYNLYIENLEELKTVYKVIKQKKFIPKGRMLSHECLVNLGFKHTLITTEDGSWNEYTYKDFLLYELGGYYHPTGVGEPEKEFETIGQLIYHLNKEYGYEL